MSASEGDTLDALSEAVESGAGLPAVTRAAAKVMDVSMILLDRAESVLAVANATGAQEKKLVEGGAGTEVLELRVADELVGELRFLAPKDGSGPETTVRRVVATLLALEVERARAPEWASEQAAREFVGAVLSRSLTEPREIAERASELGISIDSGAGVLVVRMSPMSAQTIDWRARLLGLCLRTLRTMGRGAVAALVDDERTSGGKGDVAEIAAILPASEPETVARAAAAVELEAPESMPGFALTIGYSRIAEGAGDLFRAAREAVLAANVAEGEGRRVLAFEDTGAYRLLLPAMSEDPSELQRFYEETVAPLVAYDDQYETDLLATVEAYLDCDGNVTPTAEKMFTHRHTIRYRLERIRELSGHDLTSTEGREKLGLGLKSMRVLGIASPHGPAQEAGAKSGRARKRGGD